jgi:hypothetical protein
MTDEAANGCKRSDRARRNSCRGNRILKPEVASGCIDSLKSPAYALEQIVAYRKISEAGS